MKNIDYIKKLVSECVELRVSYGLKNLDEENMIIGSLEMYSNSIKRRIRNRKKR